MEKEYVYIDGIVKFFSLTPNQWDKWSVSVYVDLENRDKLIDLQAQGVKNVLKKDEGGYYVSFSRPTKKEYTSGDVVTFDPPAIFDQDGKRTDASVGVGSKVSVKIEVYSHPVPNSKQRAKALRWESLKIHELVQGFKKAEDAEPVW